MSDVLTIIKNEYGNDYVIRPNAEVALTEQADDLSSVVKYNEIEGRYVFVGQDANKKFGYEWKSLADIKKAPPQPLTNPMRMSFSINEPLLVLYTESFIWISVAQTLNGLLNFSIQISGASNLIENLYSKECKNVTSFIGKTLIIYAGRLGNYGKHELAYNYQRFSGDNTFLIPNDENWTYTGVITDVERQDSRNTHFSSWDATENMRSEDPNIDIITLKGKGVSRLLDKGKSSNSFVNCTLEEIVKSTISEATGQTDFSITDESSKKMFTEAISPAFKNRIPYICRYKETAFEFLNRLSGMFGCQFFDSGHEIIFTDAVSKQPPVTMNYGNGGDLLDYTLSTKSVPLFSKRYAYDCDHDSMEKCNSDEMYDIATTSSNLLLSSVVSDTQRIYPDSGELQPMDSYGNTAILRSMQDAANYRAVRQVMFLKGRALTARLSVGSVMSVGGLMSGNGNYFVTSVEYIYNDYSYKEDIGFTCKFTAIPCDIAATLQNGILPVGISSERPTVVAYPQLAKVVASNSAEKRVQVQFPWQANKTKETASKGSATTQGVAQSTNSKSSDRTNWIRIETPYAGKNQSSGSRGGYHGIFFVPEVGDQVMVGFEEGDPSRPFVMGSLLRKQLDQNLEDDKNRFKSIITPKKLRINLDEKEELLSISNDLHSIDMGVEKDRSFIHMVAPKNDSGKGGDITIKSDRDFQIDSVRTLTVSASSKLSVTADSGDATINEKSIMNVEGDDTTDISKDRIDTIMGSLTESICGNAKNTVEKERSELSDEGMLLQSYSDNVELYTQVKNIEVNVQKKAATS
jgi:type VI secretion system secreted protein VgrG